MSEKLIYLFEEGSEKLRSLLGGKGAGLAEMTRANLPVPPGFTITTEVCRKYLRDGERILEEIKPEVMEKMKILESKTGKGFGDVRNPLLVSVRSGAPVSMPGMMDTILNLGLNDETVKGLIAQTGDERFAYDSYRRFIQMFGNVVMGIPHEKFEHIIEKWKREKGVKYDPEVDAETWKKVIDDYKALVKKETGRDFPQDVWEQLFMAIEAVFKSWNNERAKVYRKIHGIPEDMGTAVNVQTMVFGNRGNDSGTGVAFTRNPSTGEKKIYGEFLLNAQGEDVVAGIRTPLPIEKMADALPQIYEELKRVCDQLERYYKDVQDIEFTVEKGKLYLLQTRSGKRTAQAAVKIAVDMVKEGIIDKATAIRMVSPKHVETLLHRQVDPSAKYDILAKGLPASPGAACGKVIFSADEASELGGRGEKVILVRPETTPDDIHGLYAAQGILTSRGGMTSHAAVVARGMGKPCVVGCEAITIDLEREIFTVGDVVVKKGDIITIDGSRGIVILGEVPMVEPAMSPEFKELLSWADEIARLQVWANADTPEDARRAREFGAKGIGLCRTEHMFMAEDRLPAVKRMIMALTKEEREKALNEILPMQEGDFYEILKAMEGYPVTIRLLDPPLHEFLPKEREILEELIELEKDPAKNASLIEERKELLKRVRALQEANPMLGFRGCRLGIVYPEIYEMQVRAIFRAAVRLAKEGYKVLPDVMLPIVGHWREMEILREMVVRVAEEEMEKAGVRVEYHVGTMIELPRAALTADEIAKYAEFFSFGTNDLTQTVFGFSRDDVEGKFLPQYIERKILSNNPFEVLDRDGVGALMKIAVEKGRRTRPNLKIGICGEHGGEPSSIEFCHQIGLNYVSCSPFRVPVARLAAAHAKLNEDGKEWLSDK
ncbi:MAG: pyruvate, phosphate dikinase [Candidatus Bathyarchaeia archaeon]